MARNSAGSFRPAGRVSPPQEALRDQPPGMFPGKPHPDAGIGKRLDDQEGIAGSAPAEPRDGVHEPFLFDGDPDGIEDVFRHGQIAPGRMGAGGQRGHPRRSGRACSASPGRPGFPGGVPPR